MIEKILHIICLFIILIWLNINFNDINKLKNEIKESRVREDLLLQEVKLLDYQINVLTNEVIK